MHAPQGPTSDIVRDRALQRTIFQPGGLKCVTTEGADKIPTLIRQPFWADEMQS